eukprot:1143391-Pelagomonas_calceolata.AAC.8
MQRAAPGPGNAAAAFPARSHTLRAHSGCNTCVWCEASRETLTSPASQVCALESEGSGGPNGRCMHCSLTIAHAYYLHVCSQSSTWGAQHAQTSCILSTLEAAIIDNDGSFATAPLIDEHPSRNEKTI